MDITRNWCILIWFF